MAGKLLTVFSLLAIAGSCRGGFAATYAGYHPAYATYQAPAAVYHAAPVAQAVYHQASPVFAKTVVPSAPVYTRSYALPAPVVRTVAAPLPVAAPVVKTVAPVVAAAPVLKQVELESSPRYDFSYGVHDSITGDIKSQVETRDGGNVVGSYSVLDADGFKRTVTYTADDINGFNAVVHREPVVAARAVVPAVAQAVVSAPAPAPLPVHVSAPVASLPAPIYYPHQQQVFAPQQQVQQVDHQQQGEVVEAPVAHQPELEPTPIDYNEGQQQQQEQQQPEQSYPQEQQGQTYPQDQQFPPFSPAGQSSPAPDSDDSDVVEARSAPESDSSTTSTTAAPVAEDNQKTA